MKRVAVIGLGNIAIRHRRNLKTLFPDSILYAMSASGRIPQEQVENCDRLVSSVEVLIAEKVQLVIVASPAPFHSSHAIPLIEAGIPTLIEKPVTSDMKDAALLQNATQKYTTPVAVGYCLRHLPSAKKMKELLEQKKIGHLYNISIEVGQYLPDWRPDKDHKNSVSAKVELGGGALLELSHELDYVQWLLGPISVQHAILRSSAELGLDVEDSVDILALSEKNAVVNIHLDFLQRKANRQCRFVGSEGVIVWDLVLNEIQLISKLGVEILYQDLNWDKNQMYFEMINEFICRIDGIESQSVGILEAIQTVELIERIKKNYLIISH